MNGIHPHIAKLLMDILASSERIVTVMAEETKESFTDFNNLDAHDIVARRLTIIGEASAALLKKHKEFCESHPEIPLRQARSIRNVLVHDYDGVDLEIVWETTTVIPSLIKTIRPLLSD